MQSGLSLKKFRGLRHVLVPATRKVHDYHAPLLQSRSHPYQLRNSVGTFQRGYDPFQPAQLLKGLKSEGVRDGGILHSADVVKIGVFRSDARIVKSG